MEYNSQAAAEAAGWQVEGLWHLVNNTSCAVPGYSSPTHAWYFGREEPGSCNYDTGTKSQGKLLSPAINVTGVTKVALSFRYFRQVEFFEKGGYDKTYVEVSFYVNNSWTDWTQVWYKDSRDPSLATWRSSADDPPDSEKNIASNIIVPAGATKMRIRFVFNSVDNVKNDYIGWLIDDVSVTGSTTVGPVIIDSTPPGGIVGISYYCKLSATGGTPPYSWSIASGSLPPGLTMNKNGEIYGTPSSGGEFALTIRVTDSAGNVASNLFKIEVRAGGSSIFFGDMESSEGKWSKTGLWDLADDTACASPGYSSPTHAWYYHKAGACNYSTGARTTGTLTSPSISLPNGISEVVLNFRYLRQVEHWTGFGGPFDKTYVEVQIDGGSWKQVWYRDSTDPSTAIWQSSGNIPITIPVGASTMRVRFTFDSVDGVANNFIGWLIDDVSVTLLKGAFQIEVGRTEIDHNWKTIKLSKKFVNPVVVAKPLSLNDDDPAVVQISNVKGDSFDIRLREWDTTEEKHALETVSYIVMEEGHFVLSNGAEVEAQRDSKNADKNSVCPTNGGSVAFSTPFGTTPIVIASFHLGEPETDKAVVRNSDVAKSGFQTELQGSYTCGTIAYIAWEPGTGTIDGLDYEVGNTGTQVTDGFTEIDFGFGGRVYVQVDELVNTAINLDPTNTKHAAEDVGYIAFKGSPPLFLADMQTANETEENGTERPANLRYLTEITPPEARNVDVTTTKTVTFEKKFHNPVVVAKPLSVNNPVTDPDSAVVLTKNLSLEGFDIEVKEWSTGSNGRQAAETVGFIVMEKGHYTLSGVEMEAGRITASANWKSVFFAQTFATIPIVATSALAVPPTPAAAVTRNRNVDKSGFKTEIQSEASYVPERISYIAWMPGSGTIAGRKFKAGTTGTIVTEGFTELNFGFGESVYIKVCEESCKVDDYSHAAENVGYIAFEEPTAAAGAVFVADMQTTNDTDPANLRWKLDLMKAGEIDVTTYTSTSPKKTISLGKRFIDPVVVAKPLSYNDPHPAVVRIETDFETQTPGKEPSFDIWLQEWGKSPGDHEKDERVGYLVMEKGHHNLSNGVEVEAVVIEAVSTFPEGQRKFRELFPAPAVPVVISSVTGEKEDKAIVTRNSDITRSGFNITVQQAKNVSDDAATKVTQVSYIAWQPGKGTTGKIKYEVGVKKDINQNFATINFSPNFFSKAPIFLADMQTMSDPAPANLRWKDKGKTKVSVKVDDEDSDDVTTHGLECVGFFAFECPSVCSSTAETKPVGESLQLADALAFPNPARKTNTITFKAEGQGIAEIQVKIYNLAGSQVFDSGLVTGNSLEWHLMNSKGKTLANGVYLYMVTARGVGGEAQRSRVKKLVILR